MTHYDIAQWVDYARGVACPPEHADMRGHLDTGCDECSRAADFFGNLARVCGEMSLREAPESIVRCARAIFPSRPSEAPRRGTRIPVELIFDSFLAPATAGLRASWQVGWQALYRAGDCSLDVRIEPDLHSSRAALIGQVSNHAAPAAQMGDIAVYLKSGDQVVAETHGNRFGEFQIEYEQQRRLQLCIYLDGGERFIVAPLRKIAAEKPGSGSLAIAAPKKRRSAEKNS